MKKNKSNNFAVSEKSLSSLEEKLARLNADLVEHENRLRSIVDQEAKADKEREAQISELTREVAVLEYQGGDTTSLRVKLNGLKNYESIRIKGARISITRTSKERDAVLAEIASIRNEQNKIRLMPLVNALNEAGKRYSEALKTFYLVVSDFERPVDVAKQIRIHPKLDFMTSGPLQEPINDCPVVGHVQVIPRLYLTDEIKRNVEDINKTPGKKASFADVCFWSVREANIEIKAQRQALKAEGK